MPLTNKSEKKHSSVDLNQALSIFSKETNRLELAHGRLQEQFEKLQQKLSLFEQITQHMSDGLIFVISNGKITLFNASAALLTGLTQKKVVGSSFWDYFSDLFFGFSLSKALAEPTLSKRVVLTLEDSEISKEIEVSTSSVPEKGILILLRDRTEVKQLEQALQQSERLKELGEMAATLAHEIRNPLGGIEGYASLLKRDLNLSNHQQMVQAIIEGTRSLNQLVTNVLDYARPLKLHFAPLNLVELIHETIALASASLNACPIEFTTVKDLYLLTADRERLKLVLLNLLRNAFEASTHSVQVTLKANGTLSVSDQGVGIENIHLDKIFTPFFTTKVSGTGLGLAEADKVIRAHGGSITVDSKKGKGTTITIFFQHGN